VVIGGGAAGMSAASRARRLRPDWEIAVFEQGPYISFILCGLPYYIDEQIPSLDQLLALPRQAFEGERRIRVHTGHRVELIEPQARLVEGVDLASGEAFRHRYERLIIATGAEAIRPPIEGSDLGLVFTLRTLDEGRAIKDALRAHGPRRAVIVGAGYVGLEMAEALTVAGLEVTLIEATQNVLPGTDPEIGERIERELEEHGVALRKGEKVQALLGDGRGQVRRVVTTQGEYPADLVILGVGVRPAVALAEGAGIALGPTGAIATNARMETNVPGIYAAGDAAEALHLVTGKPVYMPLGTTANKQGRVAGENAAGGQALFPGIVGTMGVKVFDLEVARTGLSEAQARAEGFQPVTALIEGHSRARYYPGTTPLTLKLVADGPSGRLLGGQMVGYEAVAKRIDVVATALHAQMDLEALAQLDLSYAPPFATVWEPIQIAARQLLKL